MCINWSCWVTETDSGTLNAYYTALLEKSGFNILKTCDYYFTPQGFTKLWLLGESHLAIHTFPERGKTYVELTSCVDDPFYEFIKNHNLKETEQDRE